jgi:hypothetical protein
MPPGPVIPEPPSDTFPQISVHAGNGPVGIIGAGMAGLRAAMLLQKIGIPFEIIEASNRIGGRAFTHSWDPDTEFDYFDVGPMRYPECPSMASTFEVFLELGWIPGLSKKLIRYYLSSDNAIEAFNDIRVQGPPPTDVDVFNFSQHNGGTIPDEYVSDGPTKLLDKIFSSTIDKLQKAKTEKDILAVFKPFDTLSCRAYMEGARTPDQDKPEQVYPSVVVTWLETMDTATGLFDQSFSEMCLDYMDFSFPDAPRKLHFQPTSTSDLGWWCIYNGTEALAKEMFAQLKNPNISYNSTVTKISRSTKQGPVLVSVAGEQNPREYDHVICTIPFGCLRAVDLTEACLNYGQKTAIRCLNYDNSVKVGIKFSSRWWQTGSNPIIGGTSVTDRPSRTIVYPSYGDENSPGVLIASYTWAQDSHREASMIPQNGPMDRTVFSSYYLSDFSLISLHLFLKTLPSSTTSISTTSSTKLKTSMPTAGTTNRSLRVPSHSSVLGNSMTFIPESFNLRRAAAYILPAKQRAVTMLGLLELSTRRYAQLEKWRSP